MELALSPCSPPFWARGGHAQTLWGHLLPSPPLELTGDKVKIDLPDRDVLVGKFFQGTSNTVVYLFHGLGGDLSSDYMRRTAKVALPQGHSVFLINHRGCGEGEGLAVAPYHSGRAEDLSEVIKAGRLQFPRARHVAIGFSLSANALLLLLSGERGEVLPDAAIAVNAPIALEGTALKLKQGLNRIYDNRFVLLCRESIESRRRAGLIEESYRIPRFGTLHDFDNIYTAKAGGFENREDYYAQCSAKDRLRNIKTPTVILTAEDDPFVSYEDYREAKLGPNTHLHVEKFGGHMGYLSATRTPLGTRRWLDYALHEILLSPSL